MTNQSNNLDRRVMAFSGRKSDEQAIELNVNADDPVASSNAMDSLMGEFVLTNEDVADFEDAEFIEPDLIVKNHIVVLAAKPGTGKTLIMTNVAANLVEAGYDIWYVNMDCSPADAKFYHKLASDSGYKLVAPHFDGAAGIDRWMQRLKEQSNKPDDNLDGVVLVVDTLKKVGDLMNKASVKQLFNVFRALCAMGATVVCLSHCNKNLDANGNLIFEGVGDVESDCDDLIYIHSTTEGDIQTISTEPSSKVRGVFRPRTWVHNKITRELTRTENVDVKAIARAKEEMVKDQDLIDAINVILTNTPANRTRLINRVQEMTGCGRRTTESILQRYSIAEREDTDSKPIALWRKQRASAAHNQTIYWRIEDDEAHRREGKPNGKGSVGGAADAT